MDEQSYGLSFPAHSSTSDTDNSDDEHDESLKRRLNHQKQFMSNKASKKQHDEASALSRLLAVSETNNNNKNDNHSDSESNDGNNDQSSGGSRSDNDSDTDDGGNDVNTSEQENSRYDYGNDGGDTLIHILENNSSQTDKNISKSSNKRNLMLSQLESHNGTPPVDEDEIDKENTKYRTSQENTKHRTSQESTNHRASKTKQNKTLQLSNNTFSKTRRR